MHDRYIDCRGDPSIGFDNKMNDSIIKLNGNVFNEPDMDRIYTVLSKGQIIGYPTETVYGLGGDACNRITVERIFRLKKRDAFNPFIVLLYKKGDIYPLTKNVSAIAEKLMNTFWPGPLTLIFEANPGLSSFLTGNQVRVAARISSDPICKMILTAFKKPLVSTSANLSGDEPAYSAEMVFQYFGKTIDLLIDGGYRKGTPSTILDVSVHPAKLIRKGPIHKTLLEQHIGGIIDT